MMANPLFSRELLRESRNRLHFVGRTLFAGSLAVLVALLWREISGRFTVSNAQAVVALLGRSLFSIYAQTQYVALILFSTVRAAQLSDERRLGSLPLIQITRLSSGGVILGNFSSVLARALFTMLLAVPVLIVSRSFGGFTLAQLCSVSLVTILAAAHASALTLALAAVSGSAGAAIALSAVVQFLAFLLMSFLAEHLGAPMLHSYHVIGLMLSNAASNTTMLAFFATRVTTIPLLLVLARRLIKRAPARPTQPLKRLLLAADRYFLNVAQHRFILWRAGLPALVGNPVFWRERATSLMGRRDHMIRLSYVTLAAIMLVVPFGTVIAGPLFIIWWGSLILYAVPALLLLVMLVVAPATTFARERAKGALSALAVTPLRARTIVAGKFLSVLRVLVLPCLLLMLAAGSTLYLEGARRGINDFLTLLSALVCAIPVAAMIFYVAAGAKTAASGIGAGVAVLLVACAGIIPYGNVRWIARSVVVFTVHIFENYPPSGFAFILTAAFLAKRLRPMRNVVVLTAFLAVPYFASPVHGLLANAFGRHVRIADAWILELLLVPLAFAFAFLAVRGKLKEKLVMLATLPALVTFLYFVILNERYASRFVTPILLLFALWHVMRWAPGGVLNRAGLAAAFVLVLASLFNRAPSSGSLWLGEWFWRRDDLAGLLAVVLVAAAVTAFFLTVTARQLDRLLGRNDCAE